jgi:hypothetical protein
MNYLKHYVRLIRKAEDRFTVEGYSEKHHVFPKSIYGENKRLVRLTAKEHYLAHALLEKIYIKRYGKHDDRSVKMTRAFFMMNNYNTKRCRHYNAKLYESSKNRFSDMVTGVPRTEEVKEKMRKPKHDGHGKAVSVSRQGIVFSEEHINNLKKAHKTRTVYAKGYNLSDDHKEKLKKVDKSYTKTPEYREHMSKITKEAWSKRKLNNGG